MSDGQAAGRRSPGPCCLRPGISPVGAMAMSAPQLLRRLVSAAGLLAAAVALAGMAASAPATGGVPALPPLTPYYVYADMVRGPAGARGPVGDATNVFLPGEQVVWRAVVVDVFRAMVMTQASDVRVVVGVEAGPTLPMSFRTDPDNPLGGYWTASWTVPRDMPPGVYRWWVEVADSAGQRSRFEPIALDEEPATGGLVLLAGP